MFSAKKITLSTSLCALSAAALLASMPVVCPAATNDPSAKTPAKAATPEKKETKETKEAAKTPEVPIENVVGVSTEELVKHPHDYLGKNVKFDAKFSGFTNLALDYKPAMKPSKTYLSLLVLSPGSAKIPLSELKLAMLIPKEKDPETELLSKLKEGDQIEVVGKEFSAALDDPWVEILRLKKIGGSKDDEKKVASESDKSKTDAKTDEKGESKSESKSDSESKPEQ